MKKTASSGHFYQNVGSFEQFPGIVENVNFSALPADWIIIITDIKGTVLSLPVHSGYRKFDDMLRMVFDFGMDQTDNVATFLDAEYRRGKIFYGIHLSDTSLMTCFVGDTEQGG